MIIDNILYALENEHRTNPQHLQNEFQYEKIDNPKEINTEALKLLATKLAEPIITILRTEIKKPEYAGLSPEEMAKRINEGSDPTPWSMLTQGIPYAPNAVAIDDITYALALT